MTILNNILAVSWHEFRVMCTRYSILLVLSGGIFVYGLLYNYMYAPNVVRDAPVAVVDMSRTPLSRMLHPFAGCHSAGTGIDKQC